VLTGAVRELDIQAEGSIDRLADNQLRVNYHFRAGKAFAKIAGVLDWNFDLTSPSFDGKAPDPILLENNAGWIWPVSGDKAIVVRFDPPLEKIIFEANQKNLVRSFFFTDRLEPGAKEVTYTITLPEGGRIAPSPQELYGPSDTATWFRDALSWNGSPIDLSFLNAAERPAGRHGVLKTSKDQLIFEDGTPARFWGSNLAAYALIATPRENVRQQAHRMAQLGYNLMRIGDLDASWLRPNIFVDNGRHDTRHLNPNVLDRFDWWVKCLEDEGIHLWFELVYQRAIAPNDGVTIGYNEIKRNRGYLFGFSYFNPELVALMQEFQHLLLNHVNPYTKLAYKDDPAIVAVLITNENDLTHHFGNLMLTAHKNTAHNALFMKQLKTFAQQTGLPVQRLGQTWVPGPSKIFLNEMEHRFNRTMIDDLRRIGVRSPVATTNFWAGCSLFSVPSLTEGDIIDVHSYGEGEALSANPRHAANLVSWITPARVEGKPLSVTEWSVPYPEIDRFTAPLYVASVAALQGWDMMMFNGYAFVALKPPGKAEWEHRVDKWSTYNDPALCGIIPAAALAFRQGHISPARTSYCLMLNRKQLFDQDTSPASAATLRTLVEQSRLTIGLPEVAELPWLEATKPPPGATIVTETNRDFIPSQQSFVKADTGQLVRNWKYGIQTINTPKTQAAQGWVGGKTLQLDDVTFQINTRKAVVALTSVDNQPLRSSRYILITALARAVPNTPEHLPFLSEPVSGTISLRTTVPALELLALTSDGKTAARLVPQRKSDGLTIQLPAPHGTHWYVLKTRESVLPKGNPRAARSGS
jgi:hypothetical protein